MIIQNPRFVSVNKTPSLHISQRGRSTSHKQSEITISIAIMSAGELACTYASLILYDDGIAVTAEKIAALVKAANLSVESYWPSLFAKLADKRNLHDLIMNVGSGGGGGAAPVAAAASPAGGATAAAPAAEEKKEEPKEESDDDMGFSLFD